MLALGVVGLPSLGALSFVWVRELSHGHCAIRLNADWVLGFALYIGWETEQGTKWQRSLTYDI